MEPNNSFNSLNNKDNIKAFKQFFADFYPSVCLFARKYLKDADLAKDIAQEAFIEFWKRKEKFTELTAIKGFIYTVTRNKCLNVIKLRDIQENILKNKILSDDYSYELILEEETYHIVHKAINSLASQSCRIVRLSMEGNKNQDIADQLHISLNSVKTLKKNAYKQLRNQLKDYAFVLLLIYDFLNR